MPIDLKWVRSNPDQVREWQNQRRPFATTKGGDDCADVIDFNDDRSIDLVDDVLRKDELSRKKLQIIQEHKKKLKQLQLRLRPPRSAVKKNHGRNEKKLTDDMEWKGRQDKDEVSNESETLLVSPAMREDLIQEKKKIERKIRLAESDWKASLKDTYMTLCKLASPVTAMKSCGDFNDLDVIKTATLPLLLPDSGCPKSSLWMDLEQAWRQYTLRHFSSYIWVELPRGILIEGLSMDASQRPLDTHLPTITSDRALELWGSCASRSLSTPIEYCNESSSKPNDQAQKILPSWMLLLTDYLPNKSIWGEKELPRYTAIWGRNGNHSLQKKYDETNAAEKDSASDLPGFSSISGDFSLDLVALTAPSLVDAREIQSNLVEELLNYYSSLLRIGGDEQIRKKILKRVVVPPQKLHNHECSRIEIHIQLRSLSICSNTEGENSDFQRRAACNIQTLRLGWVSHWGDAATRTCDMSFAGAGVVQASGKKKYKSTNNTSTKEYVHLVEASVIDDSSSIWNKIFYVNSNHFGNNTEVSRCKADQMLVDIPTALLPYLIRPIPNPSQITLADLVLDVKKKRKEKEIVFGARTYTKDTSNGHNEQEATLISFESRLGKARTDGKNAEVRPKFPPFALPSFLSQEELEKRIRLEKLSCPYDFLFR